jgi:hypothetical protein
MLAARVEQKNGMTKDDKNGVIPLTKKAPYKPDGTFGQRRAAVAPSIAMGNFVTPIGT